MQTHFHSSLRFLLWQGNRKSKLSVYHQPTLNEWSEAQVKKLLEGLKDGKSVDSMVAELKTWCESDLRSIEEIFKQGKQAFDDFNIDNAYVKPKHLSTTAGKGQKFIGKNKLEAEAVLKDAMKNGKIVSITDNGITRSGNLSYEIIIDAEKIIGTKGETLVKIVISNDGGMLSAYPIK